MEEFDAKALLKEIQRLVSENNLMLMTLKNVHRICSQQTGHVQANQVFTALLPAEHLLEDDVHAAD